MPLPAEALAPSEYGYSSAVVADTDGACNEAALTYFSIIKASRSIAAVASRLWRCRRCDGCGRN
jgi:hypothetical protein